MHKKTFDATEVFFNRNEGLSENFVEEAIKRSVQNLSLAMRSKYTN